MEVLRFNSWGTEDVSNIRSNGEISEPHSSFSSTYFRGNHLITFALNICLFFTCLVKNYY